MEERISDDIHHFLVSRAPNSVRFEIIKNNLKQYSDEQLRKGIADLIQSGIVEKELPIHGTIPASTSFTLKETSNIPIRKYIKIGSTEVPRILKTDNIVTSLEDINEAIEQLSKYADSLETRFGELMKHEMKRYWGNLITIFGIFVAIFALIDFSTNKLTPSPSYDWETILLNNFAQVIPIAVVLGIFIFVLHRLFK
jgi:hypothetical protein